MRVARVYIYFGYFANVKMSLWIRIEIHEIPKTSPMIRQVGINSTGKSMLSPVQIVTIPSVAVIIVKLRNPLRKYSTVFMQYITAGNSLGYKNALFPHEQCESTVLHQHDVHFVHLCRREGSNLTDSVHLLDIFFASSKIPQKVFDPALRSFFERATPRLLQLTLFVVSAGGIEPPTSAL